MNREFVSTRNSDSLTSWVYTKCHYPVAKPQMRMARLDVSLHLRQKPTHFHPPAKSHRYRRLISMRGGDPAASVHTLPHNTNRDPRKRLAPPTKPEDTNGAPHLRSVRLLIRHNCGISCTSLPSWRLRWRANRSDALMPITILQIPKAPGFRFLLLSQQMAVNLIHWISGIFNRLLSSPPCAEGLFFWFRSLPFFCPWLQRCTLYSHA
jgi:hypothetical protein